MMMTQPFPAHQGMPQHPGVPPGHPMAQAQHPGMVQPGMVQHMHPGVSAAGGPQVSQPGPMMAGMPPGATTGPGGPVPNAHALQHLNPAAQAHLLQQQPYGMSVSNNNQLLQQQAMARQQRMLQQQHLQQQQQHHAGGIPVSMPAGTQGLNQAQLSAMQNPNMRGPVNMMHFQQQMQHMPPNIQQQQQQFLAMQQAQAQAQAAAQAQAVVQANSQQGQHTPQQRAAAVPPQSVTPQPQHGPPGPPGSATPSQQSNPPQHSTPQPQTHQGSQPSQSTPNLQHQQIPQSQQAMAQQQSQQQAQVSQQQQQVQHPQAQPQNGQPQVTQPQQQAQLNQQAIATPEQLKMQQQMMLEQQRRANLNSFLQNKGTLSHYVNSYFETLSTFQSNGEDADLLYWQEVVNKYYNTSFQPMTGQPWGVLRQGVLTAGTGSKSFEVNATILPRYYVTLFNNGIRRIQTHMEATQEYTPQNGYRVVYSPKASFIYWFANDCQLFVNGSLKVLVNPDYKFDLVDISVSGFREFIPRSLLQQPEPIDQKPSPRVAKNASKRMQKQQLAQPIISPPESLVNENGLPHSVQCFLEIAEPLSYMTSLISHSASNPHKSANELLRDVTALISQQPGMNPGVFQAQGQRTPNLNGPSQFASPSVVNMGLPGAQASPHLGNSAHPSPAQNHLMGPGMISQQSQGSLAANGSQGASANTSPNVSNKRRRASTVKTEGDDGVEVNGAGPTGAAKVRASPKVGGKRHKGTA